MKDIFICRTIPYTELPDMVPAGPLCEEWDFYRREAGRLLAEGHEGKFVLLKGQEIVGLYDTYDAAQGAGLDRYLFEPFLVQQVLAREPVYYFRGRALPCPV